MNRKVTTCRVPAVNDELESMRTPIRPAATWFAFTVNDEPTGAPLPRATSGLMLGELTPLMLRIAGLKFNENWIAASLPWETISTGTVTCAPGEPETDITRTVLPEEGVGVTVGVTVGVGVCVIVGVTVGVAVGVAVGVLVGVAVGVLVGVAVGTTVGVAVGVFVGVGVAAATVTDRRPTTPGRAGK